MEGVEVVAQGDPMGLRHLPARDAERTNGEAASAAMQSIGAGVFELKDADERRGIGWLI